MSILGRIKLTGLNGMILLVDTDEIFNIHEKSTTQINYNTEDLEIVCNPGGNTLIEILQNKEMKYLKVKETRKQVWEKYGL